MTNYASFYTEWLHYDPLSGHFTWKKPSSRNGYIRTIGERAEYLDRDILLIKLGPKEKPVRAHRLAYLVMTGSWPEEDVLHQDGNSQNNRWSNLETRAEHQHGQEPQYEGPVKVGNTFLTCSKDRNLV